MNDRQLEAFVSVADAGSVSAAARELAVSQQTLSYQLKSLEDELGYPLFERSSKGVALTAAGALFKPEADQMLALAERARSRACPAAAPESIRVSLRSDAGPMILLETCERFSAEHPEVEMSLVSTPLRQQYQGLCQGAFDVTEYPDNDRFHEGGLGFAKVVSSPTYCLARRQDPLAEKAAVKLSDLDGREVYVLGKGSCRGADRLRRLLAREHPDVRVHDVGFDAAQITIGSLQDMVFLGPKAFFDHNVNPAAQVALPLETDVAVDVGLAYRGSSPLPVVRKFIASARRAWAER